MRRKPRILSSREIRLISELADVDRDLERLQRRRADLATLIMRERLDVFLEEDRVIKLNSGFYRRMAIVLVSLLMATAASAQTHYPLGQALTLAWDNPPSQGFPVMSRAELQTNGGAFVNTNVPTPAASYSYALPALATGTYTFVVRFCNTDGCGPGSAPLTIVVDPARSLPGAPGNPRIVVPPGAVGVAVNGVIDRPPFKERGLDVVQIRPDDGQGTLLIGAQGLRDTSGGFTVRVGDNAGVVVWRPAPTVRP